ncbi:MAG: T9SS type A sorting domain-containing protein [Patescibacteria group bacterium]
MKKLMLFLAVIIFFVPLVLSGQIDTNRTVNGWGVKEKSSNIKVAYSEISNNVIGTDSKKSQKFIFKKNGYGGQVKFEKTLTTPIQNIPSKATIMWVYLEKFGSTFPNNSFFHVYVSFVMESSDVVSAGGIFIPGWAYTVWYPIPVGGPFENLGTQKIKKVMFTFEFFDEEDIVVLFDRYGWTDDASVVPYPIDNFEDTTIVGVEDEPVIPNSFKLFQNYPNPFNPTTSIKYEVSSITNVRLAVYDILGREVAVLVNEEKIPGEYEIQFNGSQLSSGTYFYVLQAGNFSETKKMLLVK